MTVTILTRCEFVRASPSNLHLADKIGISFQDEEQNQIELK